MGEGENANTSSVPEKRSATASPAIGVRKYKIGKVKQTPAVQTDTKTGLTFIQLRARPEEKVYGCTKFLNHYKVEKKLGQGTFGEVYKGVHLETQRQVAMKMIIINVEKDLFPITAQREITILKKLNHKNVIKIIEMVYDISPNANSHDNNDPTQTNTNITKPNKNFYMILPYMVSDLSGILHNPRIDLKMADIKNIMLQLLEGVNYIHCSKFMHRDIKAANILIDHKGIVKLADFGLARLYYGSPPNLQYPGGAGSGAKYTSVVVTRWYRAPELVLGDKHYTTAVDIWGVGCVFGEFFEKKPILQGSSDIDQGHVIFKLMGTPTEEDWKLAKYLPGKELTLTHYEGTLKERFGKYLNDTGLSFMKRLLALDPLKRYTTMAAKLDPFFTEEPLPSERLELPCEESHEADIKRYKEEMHQAMSQKAPSAPQGHRFETSSNTSKSKDLPATNIPTHTTPKRVLAPLPPGPVAASQHKVSAPLPSAPAAKLTQQKSDIPGGRQQGYYTQNQHKGNQFNSSVETNINNNVNRGYTKSYNSTSVGPSGTYSNSGYNQSYQKNSSYNQHSRQNYYNHQKKYDNNYNNQYNNGNRYSGVSQQYSEANSNFHKKQISRYNNTTSNQSNISNTEQNYARKSNPNMNVDKPYAHSRYANDNAANPQYKQQPQYRHNNNYQQQTSNTTNSRYQSRDVPKNNHDSDVQKTSGSLFDRVKLNPVNETNIDKKPQRPPQGPNTQSLDNNDNDSNIADFY